MTQQGWRAVWQEIKRRAHEEQSDEAYQRAEMAGRVGDKVARQLFEDLLRFCEFVGVMALLFALSPHAEGMDHKIIVGLTTLLWIALWLYSINVFAPKEPGPRRLVDWLNWWMGARFLASILLTAAAVGSAWRMSAVLADWQAKNSAPPPAASTAYVSRKPQNFQPTPKPKPAPANKKRTIGPPD